MTTTPPAYWTPPSRWGVGRILAIVFGVLLLLPGLGLVLGGGALLWADQAARDDDGFLNSSEESFSTSGYAISSTSIDLSSGTAWLPISSALGTARLEVTGADSGSDVFVGLARVADTTEYLGGVQRIVVTDLGSGSGPHITTGAGAPSSPPGEQDFWTEQASGPGTQTLSWKPSDGNWTLVVMNADGSADVSIDARVGATVPAAGGLGWGLLGGGLFLVIIGVLLLTLAIRRPKVGRAYTGGPYLMPSGPAPSWTPPVPVDRSTAADGQPDTTSSTPPNRPPTA